MNSSTIQNILVTEEGIVNVGFLEESECNIIKVQWVEAFRA